MNIEQRLYKLNRGSYKIMGVVISPSPLRNVWTITVSQGIMYSAAISKTSTSIKMSYSQNKASGMKRAMRVSFAAFLFLNKSTWCLNKADDYDICIFYRYLAVLTAPWITESFGLVRKWWYFERKQIKKERNKN